MKYTRAVGEVSVTYEAEKPSEVISLVKSVEDHEKRKKPLQEILSKIDEKSDDFIIQIFREDGHWLAITGADVSNKSAFVGCGATPKDALKELLINMGCA